MVSPGALTGSGAVIASLANRTASTSTAALSPRSRRSALPAKSASVDLGSSCRPRFNKNLTSDSGTSRMAEDVEQNGTGGKLQFVNRGGDVYLVRGSQELWIGPADETYEAMADFLAAEDFGER